MTPIYTEQAHHLPEVRFGLLVVPGGETDCTEVVSRANQKGESFECLRDDLGALGGGQRVRRVASAPEIVALVERYAPEPALIVKRSREALGFTEMLGDLVEFAERKERGSKV